MTSYREACVWGRHNCTVVLCPLESAEVQKRAKQKQSDTRVCHLLRQVAQGGELHNPDLVQPVQATVEAVLEGKLGNVRVRHQLRRDRLYGPPQKPVPGQLLSPWQRHQADSVKRALAARRSPEEALAQFIQAASTVAGALRGFQRVYAQRAYDVLRMSLAARDARLEGAPEVFRMGIVMARDELDMLVRDWDTLPPPGDPVEAAGRVRAWKAMMEAQKEAPLL